MDEAAKLSTPVEASRYGMIIWWCDEDAAYVEQVPELLGYSKSQEGREFFPEMLLGGGEP
jgi:hypothetical protein